ncbi:hypothetical protein Csa_017594 [Cucumis sativus]|nr:hypothetical protein Csa_017594 [Cucumis sativus]
MRRIERMAAENAVVMFSMTSCCMCHAVKRLFCGMGVKTTVYELDEDPRGKEIEKALMRLMGSSSAVPAVFIGGKLIGSMDRVMASHINGSLNLKEARRERALSSSLSADLSLKFSHRHRRR